MKFRYLKHCRQVAEPDWEAMLFKMEKGAASDIITATNHEILAVLISMREPVVQKFLLGGSKILSQTPGDKEKITTSSGDTYWIVGRWANLANKDMSLLFVDKHIPEEDLNSTLRKLNWIDIKERCN